MQVKLTAAARGGMYFFTAAFWVRTHYNSRYCKSSIIAYKGTDRGMPVIIVELLGSYWLLSSALCAATPKHSGSMFFSQGNLIHEIIDTINRHR
jgi:hypothetical protein